MVVSARALSQAVAPASHRGNDLAFGQTGGVPHGQILASPVRMMYQFLGVSTPAGGQSHFQRVHGQAGAEGGSGLPSHYELGVHVDDERRVHPPSPRANIREIGNPKTIWRPGGEVPFHQISRIVSPGGFGGAHLAPPAGNTTQDRCFASAVPLCTAPLGCLHGSTVPIPSPRRTPHSSPGARGGSVQQAIRRAGLLLTADGT